MSMLAALLLTARPATDPPPPLQTFIEAPGPSGPLKGSMNEPSRGRSPVVLMIPGSGPVDRDGDAPPALKASTLRLLAEGLAAEGIATVRIDKRGMYASAAATPDPNAVTIDGYAEDVHSWVKTIRARMGVKCVWVLGHSEGALVALVSGRESSDLCGLILVSAAGRPIGSVIADQLKSNPANAPVLDQALHAVAELEAGRRVDASDMHPALLPLFRPAVQDFLINEMSFDPAKLIASFRKPVLILQGERDIQVGVADARLLKLANPAAKLLLVPDANHVLKSVTTADRVANIATYSDPSLPLAAGVVTGIADFIGSVAN